jgi:hypothetical protein
MSRTHEGHAETGVVLKELLHQERRRASLSAARWEEDSVTRNASDGKVARDRRRYHFGRLALMWKSPPGVHCSLDPAIGHLLLEVAGEIVGSAAPRMFHASMKYETTYVRLSPTRYNLRRLNRVGNAGFIAAAAERRSTG